MTRKLRDEPIQVLAAISLRLDESVAAGAWADFGTRGDDGDGAPLQFVSEHDGFEVRLRDVIVDIQAVADFTVAVGSHPWTPAAVGRVSWTHPQQQAVKPPLIAFRRSFRYVGPSDTLRPQQHLDPSADAPTTEPRFGERDCVRVEFDRAVDADQVRIEWQAYFWLDAGQPWSPKLARVAYGVGDVDARSQ